MSNTNNIASILSSVNPAEIVAFINDNGKKLTAPEMAQVRARLDKAVEDKNTVSRNNRMDALITMPRETMWVDYVNRPTYTGVAVKEDDSMSLETRELPLKFAKLEDHYQRSKSTSTDDKGNPKPNKAVTLCSDGHYAGMVMLFNGHMAQDTASGINAKKQTVSPAVQKTLSDLGLECFLSNTKDSRLAQLNAIIKAMLPESMSATAISCDMKYLKLAFSKAKAGNVKGLGDKAVLDEICVVIKAALSYDAEQKKRSFQYSFASKSKFFEQSKIK